MRPVAKLSTFPTLFIVILSVFTFSHCESSEPELTPSNLQLQVDIAPDGSGEVTVTATADNTTSFEIDFGVTGKAPIESETGIESYTYLESGSYVVSVKAIGSKPSSFVWKTQIIAVELSFMIPTEGYTSPTSYAGMDLVWEDEFGGTALDESDWKFEIGTGADGWGNNELQYYQKANTTVADGYLVIEARKEAVGGKQYTSSRIITQGKEEIKYGRVDIRAVLPKGQGIWPALWMLGSNFNTVGWPKCGEIDIMEMIGGGNDRDNRVHGTVHWDNAGAYASYGGHVNLTTGTFADEFHVFSIVWNENEIRWLLDNVQFHVIDITPDGLSEFQEKFFFIMNVAVGGNWPGSPDATTKFPQRMAVDYIRVFQDQ